MVSAMEDEVPRVALLVAHHLPILFARVHRFKMSLQPIPVQCQSERRIVHPKEYTERKIMIFIRLFEHGKGGLKHWAI